MTPPPGYSLRAPRICIRYRFRIRFLTRFKLVAQHLGRALAAGFRFQAAASVSCGAGIFALVGPFGLHGHIGWRRVPRLSCPK